MSEDMWGDLFAQAADLGSTATTGDDQSPLDDKTRKGKKRRRVQNHESTPAYIQMVDDRIRLVHPGAAWPHWLILGGSIFSDSPSGRRCMGWKSSSTDSLNQHPRSCLNCGKPAFLHRLQLPSTIDDGHRLFQWIRNLRCVAAILAESHTPHESLLPSMANDIRDELDEQSSSLSRSMASILGLLPREEAEILNPKVRAVVDFANLLRQSLHASTKHLSTGSLGRKRGNKTYSKDHPGVCLHWEPAIRLITACDIVYYRMYYLQLTQAIPNCRYKEKLCFFPNPLEYFQLTGLTLNSGTIMDEAASPSDDPSKIHPLEQIHRLRQLETKNLFKKSGWMSSPNAKSATLISLNQSNHDSDPEANYQTPSPEVQTEWRDGCRDFLCNLYTYATVSSPVLDHLASFLKKNQAQAGDGIVEIGAGTGYLAKLMQDKGVSVEPWDLQPPSSEGAAINEYHGQTPTFVPVGKHSRLPNTSFQSKALMLCYPPPGSSMAYDTLKEYLRKGGSCLLHIGEFKGLTGDSLFEAVLTKNMTCYFREPCLTWGTDASHATLWMKDDVAVDGNSSREGSKLLLPCSRCQIQEATKLCRVERNLVYCSPKCFEDDTLRIEESFTLHCVPLRSSDLQYTNDRHFIKL